MSFLGILCFGEVIIEGTASSGIDGDVSTILFETNRGLSGQFLNDILLFQPILHRLRWILKWCEVGFVNVRIRLQFGHEKLMVSFPVALPKDLESQR